MKRGSRQGNDETGFAILFIPRLTDIWLQSLNLPCFWFSLHTPALPAPAQFAVVGSSAIDERYQGITIKGMFLVN